MGRLLTKAHYFVIGSLILVVILAWLWLLPQDRIDVTNQSGSDRATVLLDGWRTACDVNDEIHRGSSWVGNMQMDASCISEVAVFAIDNASALTPPITSWTSDSTDVLTVSMNPLLNVPLTAWVLSGLPADPVVNASRADAVYNTMQGGVSFYSVDVRDFHTQTSITSASCEDLGTLKETYPPVPSRLNVYYVLRVTAPVTINGLTITTPFAGRWCSNDPNIILMGSWATETLAHELGHAFTLLHSNSWAPSSNLMIDSSVSRSTLTTGQVFRINVDDNSRLNKNSVRTGVARPCPDSQIAAPRCPAISFDVQPK